MSVRRTSVHKSHTSYISSRESRDPAKYAFAHVVHCRTSWIPWLSVRTAFIWIYVPCHHSSRAYSENCLCSLAGICKHFRKTSHTHISTYPHTNIHSIRLETHFNAWPDTKLAAGYIQTRSRSSSDAEGIQPPNAPSFALCSRSQDRRSASANSLVCERQRIQVVVFVRTFLGHRNRCWRKTHDTHDKIDSHFPSALNHHHASTQITENINTQYFKNQSNLHTQFQFCGLLIKQCACVCVCVYLSVYFYDWLKVNVNHTSTKLPSTVNHIYIYDNIQHYSSPTTNTSLSGAPATINRESYTWFGEASNVRIISWFWNSPKRKVSVIIPFTLNFNVWQHFRNIFKWHFGWCFLWKFLQYNWNTIIFRTSGAVLWNLAM